MTTMMMMMMMMMLIRPETVGRERRNELAFPVFPEMWVIEGVIGEATARCHAH